MLMLLLLLLLLFSPSQRRLCSLQVYQYSLQMVDRIAPLRLDALNPEVTPVEAEFSSEPRSPMAEGATDKELFLDGVRNHFGSVWDPRVLLVCTSNGVLTGRHTVHLADSSLSRHYQKNLSSK